MAKLELKDIAVLVPCFNEELSIGKVVADFKRVLPGALVYVFDNRSTDRTAEIARQSGAIVVFSPHPGKGNVIRHMFELIEAPAYLMVDGDDTYPADEALKMVTLFRESHADMVVGTRMSDFSEGAFRRFHLFGNKLVGRLISISFGVSVTDVLSGYRIFSRNFVKSVPIMSAGFEIETELTLHAAAKRFVMRETSVRYSERGEGSHSKLNTFTDGYAVLKTLFFIFKDYRPLPFFGFFSLLIAILSVSAGLGPILDYVRFSYVYRVPLAILAASLAIVSVLTFMVALVLDTVAKYHAEEFELHRKSLVSKYSFSVDDL